MEPQNSQDKKPGVDFQDDTVKTLLAKARKEAEERSQMYAKSGGVLPSVPPGVKKELLQGTTFEPVIEKAGGSAEIESVKFSSVPVDNNLVTETTEPTIQEPSLKNLRTFQGDVANALKDQNASVISIAMATRKRREERKEVVQTPAEKHKERKNTWLALGSSVLLIVGLSILGGLYYVHLQELPVPIAEAPKTVISFDKSTEILFQGLTKDKFMSLIYSVKDKIGTQMGEINYLNIIKRMGTAPENTVTKTVTGAEFFGLIKTKAPLTVTKSFSDTFMLGLYQGKKSGVFILLGINSYETVFDGMFKWEKEMWNDLGALLSPNPIPVLITPPTIQKFSSTTSATSTNTSTTTKTQSVSGITPLPSINVDTNKISSTTAFIPPTNITAPFIDKVVSNKDTRVLQNQYGETVVIYGFVTRDLLLIASNEETFKAILDKAFTAQGQ